MIDGLTRWLKAISIDDQRSETVARVVCSEWNFLYGAHEQIYFDLNVQFKFILFEELCTSFGVDKTITTH